MKKKHPSKKKKPSLSPRFAPRWLELTGRKPTARLQKALVNSIVTLRANPPGGGAPNLEIFLFARFQQGEGCEKVAEIAGWYSMDLTKGGNCIGPKAVKAALDAAARQYCCHILKCPRECPCSYVPQAKLGAYSCVPGRWEEGFLLQATRVWNCFCLAM